MAILVACEESQTVTVALREEGLVAFSCDLLPCSGGHPEWHIQGDAVDLLSQDWEAVIAFPPCTDLAVSGARYFAQKRADGRQQASIALFMAFAQCQAPMVAIENPVGIMSSLWRKPDQILQPYLFGEDASKSTCLWLKGLPILLPTAYVQPRMVEGKPRWSNQTASGQNKLGPSETRAKERSKTYAGIAKAMASQWAKYLRVEAEHV